MIQCAACGFSNSDQHRFCGQCGRALQPVPAAINTASAARQSRGPAVISGPSLLGLDSQSEAENDLSYLLEEEPVSHRKGVIALLAVLLLFFGAAAFVLYQKYYFASRFEEKAPVVGVPPFAYDHTPAGMLSQNQLTVQGTELVVPSRKLSNQLALENISATMRDMRARDAQINVPRRSRDADLLAEGEKYYYGRGVVSNCKLAVQKFEEAAKLGNARAMSHLGSMYGSGRCVPFNRVKAYQWFAKAKNADPTNHWLDSSMDMLWRNMSTNERAAILK